MVRELIGVGTSARVYLAEHLALGTHVALKVLPSETHDWRTVERFRREARFHARVDSEHVPRIFDVGHLEDGSAYMVMEHVDGESLETVLERGPLPVPVVLSLGRQLLAALGAAHAAGVLHRDVKPANVILQRHASGEVRVKLLDFGVSKSLADLRSSKVTADGAIVGTPCYMAPEQARGDPLDERSDLYAVGAVLYHAVTDQLPFERPSVGDTLAAVLRDPLLPPRVLYPGCPAQLEALLMRALGKDPSLRPASAHEMSAELARIDEPKGAPVRSRTLPTATAPARSPAPASTATAPALSTAPANDGSMDDTEPALDLREPTVPFELCRPVARAPAAPALAASPYPAVDDDPPRLPLSAAWVAAMSALALAAGYAVGYLVA